MQSSLIVRSSSLTFALVLGSIGAAALSANGTGCSSQPSGLTSGTTTSTGSGGATSTTSGSSSGGGGGAKANPKDLFDALQDDFVTACGSCHEPGGISDRPFLAPPDRYQSVTSWPGIIVKDSTQSILLTHPISGGGHTGTNLDSGTLKTTLYPKIKAWLAAESAAIANPIEPTKPSIAPVAPIMGFNAIYLTPLDKDLEGVAITFNADSLTKTTLQITDLQVHTTTKTGVHMTHPLFVVYPVNKEADPDPVDNFATLDAYFDKDTSSDLGQGSLILDNWSDNAKLSIVFQTVEPYVKAGSGGDGGGGAGDGSCKDLTEFNKSAATNFQNNCFGCHGGANSMAVSAVDMSKLQSDPGTACAQIKNRVKPSDPPNSVIFITTDPGGNAAHPFKFGGSATQFGTFKTNVSTWIAGEK